MAGHRLDHAAICRPRPRAAREVAPDGELGLTWRGRAAGFSANHRTPVVPLGRCRPRTRGVLQTTIFQLRGPKLLNGRRAPDPTRAPHELFRLGRPTVVTHDGSHGTSCHQRVRQRQCGCERRGGRGPGRKADPGTASRAVHSPRILSPGQAARLSASSIQAVVVREITPRCRAAFFSCWRSFPVGGEQSSAAGAGAVVAMRCGVAPLRCGCRARSDRSSKC